MKKLYTLLVALAATGFAASAAGAIDVKLDNPIGERPTGGPARESFMEVPTEEYQEEGWKDVGYVEYTDDCFTIFTSFNTYTWNAWCQESTTTPGLYRLCDPYTCYPGCGSQHGYTQNFIIIHAENPDRVYFEKYSCGINLGYGNMWIESQANAALLAGSTEDEVEAQGLFGKLQGGNITMPVRTLYTYLANYNGGNPLVSNSNGKWGVKFPEAKDYSFEVKGRACPDADNELTYEFTVGADVQHIKYLVVQGNYAISDANFQTAATGGTDVDGTGSLTINVQGYDDGRYTIFFAVVDDEGAYITGDGYYFWMPDTDDSNWEYLTDVVFEPSDFCTFGYSFSNFAAEPSVIEMEENVNTPGYYRLVNPFGPSTCYAQWAEDFGHNHYIYVHAEDPAKVWIEQSPVGIKLLYGDLVICSYAENVLTDPELYGTKEGRVISFPAESILRMQMWDNRTSWSRTNRTSPYFSITISKLPNWIEWDQTDLQKSSYTAGEEILLTAESQSGVVNYSLAYCEEGESTYTPEVPDGVTPIAELVGENLNILKINRQGKIRLSASAPEDDTYQMCMPVNKFITISDVTGIESIGADTVGSPRPVYYTLQGIRTARPAKGQTAIRVIGTTATKVVVD